MQHNMFCARGPFCWGVGNTREKAIRNAKRNWPGFLSTRPLAKNFDVFVTDAPAFSVDEMGGVGVAAGFSIEQLQRSALAKQ